MHLFICGTANKAAGISKVSCEHPGEHWLTVDQIDDLLLIQNGAGGAPVGDGHARQKYTSLRCDGAVVLQGPVAPSPLIILCYLRMTDE